MTFFSLAPNVTFWIEKDYLPMLRQMRSKPLRVSGVEPANCSNSSSLIARNRSSSIVEMSITESKRGFLCSGARRL